MNEKDLEILTELVNKASKNAWYDLAHELKEARDLLKKKLDDIWVDNILKQIENYDK